MTPVLRTLAVLGITVDLYVGAETPDWTRRLTLAADEAARRAGVRQSARTGQPPVPYRRTAKRRPPESWLKG